MRYAFHPNVDKEFVKELEKLMSLHKEIFFAHDKDYRYVLDRYFDFQDRFVSRWGDVKIDNGEN